MKTIIILMASLLTVVAQGENSVEVEAGFETSVMEELNPFDANIEEQLNLIDQQYKASVGESVFTMPMMNFLESTNTCYRLQCSVYAHVVLAEQKMYLYVNGRLDHSWDVSSGASGHGTPRFDTHPNGRIYDKYTSSKFPDGDWNGLGNMPYVVFIRGGFAIHGTTKSNIPKLGTRASHGCIRLHPENGKIFNRLVRHYGIKDVWITVE